jgi:hypothetical protein
MSISLDPNPGWTGPHLVGTSVVNWWVWLSFAAIIAAFVATLALQPEGTRPVARTRLMVVARVALVAFVGLYVYLAYRASGSG